MLQGFSRVHSLLSPRVYTISAGSVIFRFYSAVVEARGRLEQTLQSMEVNPT